jgi:hypothetical protein
MVDAEISRNNKATLDKLRTQATMVDIKQRIGASVFG